MRMEDSRYFLLFRDKRRVRATEATHLISGDFPFALTLGGREYRVVANQDTFIFWNDLLDPLGRTVGYRFLAPDMPTLTASSLVSDSDNVVVENCVCDEVTILLQECDDPREECVQGFTSEVYQSTSDPLDCVLLMYDWPENPIGFDLATGVSVTRLS